MLDEVESSARTYQLPETTVFAYRSHANELPASSAKTRQPSSALPRGRQARTDAPVPLTEPVHR